MTGQGRNVIDREMAKGLSGFRLAAVDLDDTLLGPDKKISPGNAAAVRQLRAAGVRVVLASGRRHGNMLPFHRQLELEGPIISCQGAVVRHAETGETWWCRNLPPEIARELVDAGAARRMTQLYYTEDRVLVEEQDHLTALYEGRTGTKVEQIEALAQLEGQDAHKIIWLAEPERVAAEYQGIAAEYRGRIETVVTDPEYIELLAPGVTKAAGLAAVAEHFGVRQTEVLAFGDGDNDVAMLRWAGLGVAMANGRPAALAAASMVAPAGNLETAFARAVEAISRGTFTRRRAGDPG